MDAWDLVMRALSHYWRVTRQDNLVAQALLENKRLQGRLDTMMTGDGRRLPPFLRHDIERMIRHYEFICGQLAEVEADRKLPLTDETSSFPHRDKVRRLAMLGSVGETTATVLVAEVFHRTFETRRHLASFIGLAPSPYASGEVSRDRGINKAGTKLARQTLVELAWFWLRYQPNSKLSLWWHERFGGMGMRGRKVGIVALARKLGHRPVALCRTRGGAGGRHVEDLTRTTAFLSLRLPHLRGAPAT
jgi:transposase